MSLPTEPIGSIPRPAALLTGMQDHANGRITDAALADLYDAAVQDTIAPVITCPPPITAQCTGRGRAFVRPGQASSSDICTDVTVNGPRPRSFRLGTTTVNYTSTDGTGHEASCSSTITVVDTAPPHVDVRRRVTLWPPDHRYRTVDLEDCGIAVEDACRGRLDPSTYRAAITCVTSSEPDNEPRCWIVVLTAPAMRTVG